MITNTKSIQIRAQPRNLWTLLPFPADLVIVLCDVILPGDARSLSCYCVNV